MIALPKWMKNYFSEQENDYGPLFEDNFFKSEAIGFYGYDPILFRCLGANSSNSRKVIGFLPSKQYLLFHDIGNFVESLSSNSNVFIRDDVDDKLTNDPEMIDIFTLFFKNSFNDLPFAMAYNNRIANEKGVTKDLYAYDYYAGFFKSLREKHHLRV